MTFYRQPGLCEFGEELLPGTESPEDTHTSKAEVLPEALPAVSDDLNFDREHVILSAKDNLDFLSALALPEIYEFPFPTWYHALWQLLRTRADLVHDFTKLAIGLPRGHVKTGFLKLFCLYLILYTDRQFILIVAATKALAENILADIMDMLGSDNIRLVYGDWQLACEKDTQAVKKFGFKGRNIVLAALGSGSSPRGLNIKNVRPDFLLMDDIQTREVAESAEQSDALLKWLLGTLLKTKSSKRCMAVYLGNMYPTPGCILKKLADSASWISLITGAILADGKALWPDLRSLDDLLQEFMEDMELGHPEIFLAEVLNDPEGGSRSKIDISKIPVNPYLLGVEEPNGRMIIIDPSTDKVGADSQAIGVFDVYEGKPVLIEIISGSFSPLECIRQALLLGVKHNCCLIGVESVAYQSTLLFWFDYICKQLGLTGFIFVELFTKGVRKNTRIISMFRSLLAGEVYLSDLVRSSVLSYIVMFDPNRTNNKDDELDVLGYAIPMWQTYGHLQSIPDSLEPLALEGAKVFSESASSLF